jgi:hypothetical protein
MFTAEEKLKRMRERPFRPVRILVSEGMHFDIKHPDMVFVGRHDVTIGTPDPASPSIYAGQMRVALVHIVALEDLPVPPPAPTNGPVA